MPNARCAVPVVSPDARCAAWLRTSVTPVADRGAQTRHWMCLACAAVRPGAARCCPVLLALLSPPDLPQDAPAVPRDVWMKSGWAAPHRHAPGEPYPKSARNSKGGEGRVSSGTCLWEPKVAKADGTTGVAFRASSTGSTGGPLAGRDGLFAGLCLGNAFQQFRFGITAGYVQDL